MTVPTQRSLIDGSKTSIDAALRDPGADYGEVFTRRWVVEFILDMVEYTEDRDLGSLVLVEPSCGSGAFLIPIVDRLIASAIRHGTPLRSLERALRAFDLLEANAKLARKAISVRLQDAGLGSSAADELARSWVVSADFLLHEHESRSADVVVGNPPYIRLENVPPERMRAYRTTCTTMRGRADVYVGFIERGLSLLREGGILGFICADRWMHNQYGGRLRELVSTSYSVDTVVSMHGVNAFDEMVSAYPAVVTLRNGSQGQTRVIEATAGFDADTATRVSSWARRSGSSELFEPNVEASRLDRWFEGRDLWPSGRPARMAVVADLEAAYAPLEDERTGTKVGIGVATGCDDVYLTQEPDIVEPSRLLPLLRPSDIASGTVQWSGTYLVNPWAEDGLADLHEYPKMRQYMRANSRRLRARHIARQRPVAWYRTIDRVNAELRYRAKLVLPDMKATAHPVLDDGGFYPHHNLYYIISDAWDPEVLGGLLLSGIANLFVGAYCVRMRGVYRFQAQYIRRIRVPEVRAVDKVRSRDLADAFRRRDVEAASDAAAGLYGLTPSVLEELAHAA